jgi:hypothetical protein
VNEGATTLSLSKRAGRLDWPLPSLTSMLDSRSNALVTIAHRRRYRDVRSKRRVNGLLGRRREDPV